MQISTTPQVWAGRGAAGPARTPFQRSAFEAARTSLRSRWSSRLGGVGVRTIRTPRAVKSSPNGPTPRRLFALNLPTMLTLLRAAPQRAAAADGDCAGPNRLIVQVDGMRSEGSDITVTLYPDDEKKFLAKTGKMARVRPGTVMPITEACFTCRRRASMRWPSITTRTATTISSATCWACLWRASASQRRADADRPASVQQGPLPGRPRRHHDQGQAALRLPGGEALSFSV